MENFVRIILLISPVSGCFLFSFLPADECSSKHYADSRYSEEYTTTYKVGKTVDTDHGTKVDNSGFVVDMSYIDQQTGILEKCLDMKITSCAVTVKVAEDWQEEPAGQWFPCKVLTGKCAGIYQYPNVLVLPPSLRAYRHELIHLVTHQDHSGSAFQKCDGQ